MVGTVRIPHRVSLPVLGAGEVTGWPKERNAASGVGFEQEVGEMLGSITSVNSSAGGPRSVVAAYAAHRGRDETRPSIIQKGEKVGCTDFLRSYGFLRYRPHLLRCCDKTERNHTCMGEMWDLKTS